MSALPLEAIRDGVWVHRCPRCLTTDTVTVPTPEAVMRAYVVPDLPAQWPRLTGREALIARALVAAQGDLVDRTKLAALFFPGSPVTEFERHLLRVHVTRIRRKIEPLGWRIAVEVAAGYRLLAPADALETAA